LKLVKTVSANQGEYMRAHISINVSNVTNSVEFYKKIFGVSPQKQTNDYAKFDLKNPALNFTMQNVSSGAEISKVSHLGIEVDSADEIMKWQNKLTENGLVKLVETDSNCCFARQDKVWVQDPDGNSWEFFYVHEQLSIEGELNKSNGSACCTPSFLKEESSCCPTNQPKEETSCCSPTPTNAKSSCC
jgi:catechol 2,3-dioxygenase-like lactoylglutathione lyase family enzyme